MNTPLRALATACLAVTLGPADPALSAGRAESDLLRTAQAAARWIRSSQIDTGRGLMWPIDPARPDVTSTDLYSGTPGVILFMLELHEQTDDRQALWDARQGAMALDLVNAQGEGVAAKLGNGLYVGLGGTVVALDRAAKVTGDDSLRLAAGRALDRLIENIRSESPHPSWTEVTDVISGRAGVGFVLLHAARSMGRDDALALAREAGDGLLRQAVERGDGLMWRMAPDVPNTYPNFSHGTAGVCSFLVELFNATSDQTYLDAAVRGARYLISIADTQDGRCLVPRFDPSEYPPGEPPLYYYGWCHGPAGTGRLFHALYKATGDAEWKDWRDRAGSTLLEAGLPGAPGARRPGFWDNVGVCCGNAGVARFALFLHRETGDARYLDFARKLTSDLIERASRNDGAGHVMWFHAEHRVQPENLAAQTGLMQGAAGIGLWLLELDAYLAGRAFGTTLPDVWR